MKYKIGGDFWHRHPGRAYTITDIKDGMYYIDYEDDPISEQELNEWEKEGWTYTPPEVFEEQERQNKELLKKHYYPKNLR